MNVAFISFSKRPEAFIEDPSFRYRCQNLSAALCSLGISSSIHHIDSFYPTNDTTHVVFHRPKNSIKFRRLIKKLQLIEALAIADFDDLVFHEDYLDFSPALLNNILPKKKIAKIYRSHFEALNYIDNISVSTNSLAKYVHKLFPNKRVNVLHNTTHFEWPKKGSSNLLNHKPIITYFPGTRSHDRDFWQIEEVITLFLSQNPSASLLVIGPLDSELVNKQHSQVKHIQKLPFNDYAQATSNSWVNLLPLEPTPFNQCKSAIKIIETATYSIPTICSPLPDALRFEATAAFTAIDQQQWLEHLNKMMNPLYYKEVTTKIKKDFYLTTNTQIMVEQFKTGYDLKLY
jgi:hypothetical protein